MNELVQIDALQSFSQQTLPQTTIKLLNLPKVPNSDMLVIRNPQTNERVINGMFTSQVTTFEFIYFHENIAKVVENREKLRKAFVHGITIPYKDDGIMWYMRVQAFSPSQITKIENGLDCTLSILEVTTKGIRNVEQYEKMEELIRVEVEWE